jgi:hypothetical protein
MVTVMGSRILGNEIFFTASAFSIIMCEALSIPSENANQKNKEERRK